MIIVITLLVCAALAIGAVGMANLRENKRKANELLQKQRKKRIQNLMEIQWAIEPLMEKLDVVKVINAEIMRLIELVLKSDANDQQIKSYHGATEQALTQLAQGQRRQPLNRAKSSEGEVERAQYCLGQALTLIRTPQMMAFVGTDLSDAIVQELNWSQAMVDVITRITHGHMAKNGGNPTAAVKCYKEALESINNAVVVDPRKDTVIQELNQLLRGDRLALSYELMPESKHNPKAEEPRAAVEEGPDPSKKNYW